MALSSSSTSNGIDDPCVIGADNFEIIKLLGVGSQGKVYLVRLKDTDRFYAMKVFKKQQIIQNEKVRVCCWPRRRRAAATSLLGSHTTIAIRVPSMILIRTSPSLSLSLSLSHLIALNCGCTDDRFDPHRASLPRHEPTPVHHAIILFVPQRRALVHGDGVLPGRRALYCH